MLKNVICYLGTYIVLTFTSKNGETLQNLPKLCPHCPQYKGQVLLAGLFVAPESCRVQAVSDGSRNCDSYTDSTHFAHDTSCTIVCSFGPDANIPQSVWCNDGNDDTIITCPGNRGSGFYVFEYVYISYILAIVHR